MIPTVLSKYTLRDLLYASGLDLARVVPFFSHEYYALASQSWWANEFAYWLRTRLPAHLGAYQDGITVCDDYASFTVEEAKECHRFTAGRPPGCSLAIARFVFVKSQDLSHEVNLVACPGEKPFLTLFEPQNCLGGLQSPLRPLTPEHWEQCVEVLF